MRRGGRGEVEVNIVGRVRVVNEVSPSQFMCALERVIRRRFM
jgi:hypothetical protein